jgi:hypothetical protein
MRSATTSSTVTRLRPAGLRANGPCLAILAALEGDGSHPTPEAVLESLSPYHPSLSCRRCTRRSRHSHGRAAVPAAGG